jgi:hypothetical protein
VWLPDDAALKIIAQLGKGLLQAAQRRRFSYDHVRFPV